MVISLNQESEVIYKAAFDKDLIRASCQHVSRWPKNGGRQKILEKMVCCPDLGFPYTYIYIEFVLFDQPSPRQMCDEFVRGGGSAQMNPSAHAPHVVTVLSIFDATPPHLLLSVKFSVQ